MGAGPETGTLQFEKHHCSPRTPPYVHLRHSTDYMQKAFEGVSHIDYILQAITCCLRKLSSISVPHSSMKKKEPDIKVKKHKRKESSNELSMCLNFAVDMQSFSLGFPSRITHLMSSNWHMEWFTDGSASVTLVAVHDYLSRRCFSLYLLASSQPSSQTCLSFLP